MITWTTPLSNNNPYLKYGCQLGLIGVLTQLRATNQYTFWNLVFSALQVPMGIEPSVLFLSSAAVWTGFQYGATDGTKHRLIRRARIPNIPTFICLDVVGHFIPMLWWGNVVMRSKRQITTRDWANQSAWVAMYYAFVIKGFNGYSQYTDYPYWRQVFQSAVAPPTSMYVMNAMMRGNLYPLIGALSAVWYGKDYLDLHDTRPGCDTPPYYTTECDKHRSELAKKIKSPEKTR